MVLAIINVKDVSVKVLLALVAAMVLLSTRVSYAEGFTVTSPVVSGQLGDSQVYAGFGCSGINQSPQLDWHNAPKGTKSFAVTVYDPDAPTGSGWWHWLIFDIPASVNGLATGAGNTDQKSIPAGSIQGTSSFGEQGFGGACPPAGDAAHQYQFTVHALKVDKLGVDASATAALVGFMLGQHGLAKASVTAYYAR